MTHDDALVTAVTRPHPARSARDTYPVTRAEFNTAVFPGVYQQAIRSIRVVVASSVLHYLAEAHWPAAITTGLGVGRIGRTSYVLSTALFTGDACVSLCDTVLVTLVDDAPAPIPDAAREYLDAHRLR
jgi:acyl-CoA thioester hydrolase